MSLITIYHSFHYFNQFQSFTLRQSTVTGQSYPWTLEDQVIHGPSGPLQAQAIFPTSVLEEFGAPVTFNHIPTSQQFTSISASRC